MAGARASAPVRVEAAGRTDVGRRRDHNEDNILVKPEIRLFIVADGMGGHNAGEVASALAVTSLENLFAATAEEEIPEAFAGNDGDLMPSARRLAAAVRKANADVYEIASTRKQHSGMGSTVVVAHVCEEEERIHICHVGDSRCYRIRNGEIEQLTRDHSLINDALAMRPDLTEDILAELPANVITRAVGTQEDVEVDVRTEELREEDLYLLCTDGLSGLVSEEQIAEVCNLTDDLDEMCELLIIMANEAGGNDNITALAIRIASPDAVRPSVADRTESVEFAVGEDEARPAPERPKLQLAVAVEEGAAKEAAAAAAVEEVARAREPAAATAAARDLKDTVPDGFAVKVSPVLGVEVEELIDVDVEMEERADEELEIDQPISVAPVVQMDEGRSWPPPGTDAAEEVARLELEAGALVEDDIPTDAAELEVEETVEQLAASEGTEATVAVCTSCGHELLEGSVFCVECGTQIDEGSVATVPLSELQAPQDAHFEVAAEEEDSEASGVVDEQALAAAEAAAVQLEQERGTPDDEAEFVEEEEPAVFCHECGAHLFEETRFCVQCGVRVG